MDNNEIRKFHTLQPLRDLESNWSLDLATSLEHYLLNICSSHFTHSPSINFAEAALLLQGSVQVYSRKVEYLYNLVLHALEFISQTRSQEPEEASVEPEASSSRALNDDDDHFWVSDEIPVDPKSCLDNFSSKDASLDHFVKPPANLVVLEGDCLDSTADGELESYLLATNNFYRDFILIDPCDAVAVDEFLKDGKFGEENGGYRENSLLSKAHKSFLSPSSRQSGGTARKSSVKKGLDISQAGGFENPNHDLGLGPNFEISDNDTYGSESDDHHLEKKDLDDSDSGGDDNDPWKPLNPHEPGCLKVKPFRKVKVSRRVSLMKHNISSQFPLAKLHGTVSSEFTDIWAARCAHKAQEESQLPLYEKLRNSLVDGVSASNGTFVPPEDGDGKDMFDDECHDFDQPDFDMPDVTYMDGGVSSQPDKHDGFPHQCDLGNADVDEDPKSHASLEDLCRAHLDALLASIAENENQTELAIRVSTWKQRIEHDLEEEDSRPPFDIHEYSEMILEKLSVEEGDILPFTDVVKGQEKADIARSFSALLQLVNDRKVDLDRSPCGDDLLCYTAVNPFHVQLLNHKEPKKMQFHLTKKRQKSPIKRERNKGEMDLGSRKPSPISSPSSGCKSKPALAQPSCKVSRKQGKNSAIKCTPDGKRRRRSRLIDSVGVDVE